MGVIGTIIGWELTKKFFTVPPVKCKECGGQEGYHKPWCREVEKERRYR